jgi:hypothetical protein
MVKVRRTPTPSRHAVPAIEIARYMDRERGTAFLSTNREADIRGFTATVAVFCGRGVAFVFKRAFVF